MQQINLYLAQKPDPVPKKVSKKLAISLTVVIVASVGLISFSYMKLSALKEQLNIELTSAETAKSAVSKLKSAAENSISEDDLKVELIDLKDKIRHKQAVKNTIKDELLIDPGDFTGRLISLAKQDVKGLWLTEIKIEGGGYDVTLRGEAKDPALITDYLRRLAVDGAFLGLKLTAMRIGTEEEPVSSTIPFIISSKELETEPESIIEIVKDGGSV